MQPTFKAALAKAVVSVLGGLSIRNDGQNRSHFTISQRSESHHRSRSHFATSMMVLHRKWANDLGTKLPNWKTNFARNYCEKRPKSLRNFLIERPPWYQGDGVLYEACWWCRIYAEWPEATTCIPTWQFRNRYGFTKPVFILKCETSFQFEVRYNFGNLWYQVSKDFS